MIINIHKLLKSVGKYLLLDSSLLHKLHYIIVKSVEYVKLVLIKLCCYAYFDYLFKVTIKI